MRGTLFSFFLFFFSSFYAGFSPDTVVLSPQGFMSIGQLQKGSCVTSYDVATDSYLKGAVSNHPTYTSSLACKVICEGDTSLIASQNQLVRCSESWCFIKDLKKGDRLKCCDVSRRSGSTETGNSYALVLSVEVCSDEQLLCEMTIDPYHTFCVIPRGIIVHNSPVAVLSIAPAVIPVAVKAAGIVATVGAALYSLFAKNARSSINRSSINNSSSYSTPSLPPEDPENEKNFYEKIKNRADRIARTKRFGKLYRDPETKLWWSKDNAHHGGSRYKVFKEGNRGFEWKFDGDAMGKIIENKHKGAIGRFIPYSEVIFLK